MPHRAAPFRRHHILRPWWWCCHLLLLAATAWGAQESPAFVPDLTLKPDDVTVLMGVDARRPPELTPRYPSNHGKFFLVGWTNAEQVITWDITVPSADDYLIQVVAERKSEQALEAEVTVGTTTQQATLPKTQKGWDRFPLPKPVHLTPGKVTISLRLRSTDHQPFQAFVQGLELVRPAVREAQRAKALAQRSDTTWFQQARYGIFVHWTWQTKPRTGEPKPYAQAVADFDVPAFVAQMKDTGAGVVVLTTSHAYQSIPGPNRALDGILPGRTATRDLIGDLADALNKEGIRLMLYYHLGATNDRAWQQATGFFATDTTRFFANWEAIIREVGERYGTRLAGWWFDDGSTNYYYRSPPWERLAAAAKAGNPQRIIGFNPWTVFSPTEFQDFYCGETNQDPASVGGLLTPSGTGRYPSGPLSGLQGSACFTLDGTDWVHGAKNQEIRPTRFKPERLAAMLTKFIERKNVPLLNLEIYQEGTVSPATVEVFRQARALMAAAPKAPRPAAGAGSPVPPPSK